MYCLDLLQNKNKNKEADKHKQEHDKDEDEDTASTGGDDTKKVTQQKKMNTIKYLYMQKAIVNGKKTLSSQLVIYTDNKLYIYIIRQ